MSQHASIPGPTVAPPSPANLASVLNRNIDALQERRRGEERKASTQDKIAEAITRFTGSMAFVYIHLVVFGLWIAFNAGVVPGFKPWDPTFVILATEASVEAIFLSTFVLISQNRAAALAILFCLRSTLSVESSSLTLRRVSDFMNLSVQRP